MMMCCNRAAHSRLNHVKSHWLNPVMFSGVACQLCLWDIGEKVIVYIQTCILCNFNICVKHLALFHMSRMLVEDNQNVASLEKYRLSKGETRITRTGKGRRRNMVKQLFGVILVSLMEAAVDMLPWYGNRIMG